ncbi:Pentatricopeptide repeat-containing protein [Durusdinium trenchii]|uniref:Pentatricopeptide repeat-containing protein n=1 Tax=Durusdinium trenchii TaxID=1381693 RepID=A0ABP0S1F0_9DINO
MLGTEPGTMGSSPEERAQVLSNRLRSMPPICKYKGFIPATRELCGETFTQQCFSARENRRTGGAHAMEAWTKNGVGAAGRIVFNGKGLRPDLQELHSPQECRAGLDVLLSARERGSTLMSSSRRPGSHQVMNASFIPPIEQRTGRFEPASMEAAGSRSLTRRFQKLRLENYRHEIMESIRRGEPNAGRR